MKNIFAILITLAVLGTVTSALAANKSDFNKANIATIKGNQSLKKGNLAKARTNYDKALAAVPGYPHAHIALGNMDMAGGDFTKALAHYEQARDGFVLFAKDLRDIQSRRYADSQRQILALRDSIVQIGSGATTGGSSMSSIQISQIENKIDQLSAIQPPAGADKESEAPGEIHYLLGNALFRLDRIPEALAAWEKCRELTPNYPPIYNNLAIAYWKQGQVDKALAVFAMAEESGVEVNAALKADLEKASKTP
jgi:pentatricopeptide repeat protein